MLAIGFRFPAGRFHATPWGRHVNEAEVEWPPSPWRIVRALVAVWHRLSQESRGEIQRLEDLLAHLAHSPPFYAIPPAIHSHVRHYMPMREGTEEKKRLVFDGFLRIDPWAELVVAWPHVELQSEEKDLLDRLLSGLGYLGRAESWVVARRVESTVEGNTFPTDEARTDESLARQSAPEGETLTPDAEPDRTDERQEGGPLRVEEPHGAVSAEAPQGGDFPERAHELVPLLCPLSPRNYAAFVEKERGASSVKGSAKTRGKAKTAKDVLPSTWLEAVSVETATLRSSGWSLPPGATVVWYRRPKDAVKTVAPPVPVTSIGGDVGPTVVRYAVYGKPLPRIEEALKVTEALRKALMARLERRLERIPNVLSGHDMNGSSNHRHAFYLPEPDGAGRIAHLMVYAPAGLEPEAVSAIGELRRLYLTGGQEWELWLEGAGAPSAFSPACPVFRSSTRWVSLTPYMHPWHVKKGFGPWDQIRKECRLRGLPLPSQATRLEEIAVSSRPLRPSQFHRFRAKRGLVQPDRRGSFWMLEFPDPVAGPLVLGFACHFGMGLFVPAEA